MCAGCRRIRRSVSRPGRSARAIVADASWPSGSGPPSLMATTLQRISALQSRKIGSYRARAWLLAHNLARSHGRPLERNPLSGLVKIRRGQPSIRPTKDMILPPEGKDAATTARCVIVGAIELRGRKHPCRPPAAAAEISSYGAATSDTSVETAADPDGIRKPTAGPATLRSPPIATMSMSSVKTAASPRGRGSTKSSPTSRRIRRGDTTGCVASHLTVFLSVDRVRLRSFNRPQNAGGEADVAGSLMAFRLAHQ